MRSTERGHAWRRRPGIAFRCGFVLPAACMLTAMLLATVAPRSARAEVSEVTGGIRFTYHNSAAAAVDWAGVFNNWSTTANPMTKDGDVWSIVLPLPAGEHQYKFV